MIRPLHPFYCCCFIFFFVVSGDTANSLVDTSAKGFREGKERTSKAKTTTPATSTTALAVTDTSPEPIDEEAMSTTETLAVAQLSADYADDELDVRLGNISNVNGSDARGIMSNIVKAVNRCTYPFAMIRVHRFATQLFFCLSSDARNVFDERTKRKTESRQL